MGVDEQQSFLESLRRDKGTMTKAKLEEYIAQAREVMQRSPEDLDDDHHNHNHNQIHNQIHHNQNHNHNHGHGLNHSQHQHQHMGHTSQMDDEGETEPALKRFKPSSPTDKFPTSNMMPQSDSRTSITSMLNSEPWPSGSAPLADMMPLGLPSCRSSRAVSLISLRSADLEDMSIPDDPSSSAGQNSNANGINPGLGGLDNNNNNSGGSANPNEIQTRERRSSSVSKYLSFDAPQAEGAEEQNE
eukprot:c16662_g1_i4.p1 GENE.c16662_g1_i4~~c16662_g1_i4.p1  ORF type:complete len:244 (-),score=56.26 c16662_g1_i4:128-859(-)